MKNFLVLFAATVKGCTGSNCNVDVPEIHADQLLTRGLNITYYILGGVAVIFIILAGYQYLTANGEPGKAQKAMQTILYAVIGLVVVVSAFAITNFVAGRM